MKRHIGNNNSKKSRGFAVSFPPASFSERRLRFYTAPELLAKTAHLTIIRQNIQKPAILKKIDFELLTIKSIL